MFCKISGLEVSIDKLLGYVTQDKRITIYEEEYKTQEYYWGTEPNQACYQVLQLMPPTKHLKLLDVGCGEGKDAVFFARNGYDVSAFDVSDSGIEKTRSLAEKIGVHVNVFKADILDYRLDSHYDKSIQNNIYALKTGWSFSKSRVLDTAIYSAIAYFEWLFNSTFFIRYVVNAIDQPGNTVCGLRQGDPLIQY